MTRRFAVITGASSGIGLELAKIAAADGFDLLIVADEPEIDAAARQLQRPDIEVRSLIADLATLEGVDNLLEATGGRPIDVLCANAGRGLGHGFLDQRVEDWRRVIDTNITGTLYLLQRVLNDMAARATGGERPGRVLVTGSIAGVIPGTFQAVYNGTKAFLDSFTDALRNELKDVEGLTITTLMPGPTETEFFERADMMDTSVGQQQKDDAGKVARDGWDAMMAGKHSIVSGLKNKMQVAAAHIVPASVMAEQHRKMAEPGTGS
jgi:short-subunit dehydrogenase